MAQITCTLLDNKGKLVLTSNLDMAFNKVVNFEDNLGKWDAVNSTWVFPPLYSCIEDIQIWARDSNTTLNITSPLALEIIKEEFGYTTSDLPINALTPKEQESWNKLYSFQKKAVEFLYNNPYKVGLLSLSPGLGKTVTTLITLALLQQKRILVVCPKILIPTWEREIKKWTDFTAVSCHSKKPDTSYDINIINYATFSASTKWKLYAKEKYNVLVLDESLMVKNYRRNSPKTSKRAYNIGEVRKTVKYTFLISGSPVSRYIDDLFGQLRMMLPKVYTSYWKFAETHCIVDRNVWSTAGRYGGTIVGTKFSINPRQRFKDLMFSVHMDELDKWDKGSKPPEYINVFMPLEMEAEQRKIYDMIYKEEVLPVLEEHGNDSFSNIFETLTKLTRLRQATSNPVNFGGKDISIKNDAIASIISEHQYDLPMLIWTYERETAKSLYKFLTNKFKKDVTIGLAIGGQSNNAAVVERYVQGDFDVLILSVDLGKYGLTLTNSRTIISYDRTWSADAMYQAMYRTRRLKLTFRPVWVTLYVKNSFDEVLTENLSGKFLDISKVTGAELINLLATVKG